MQRIMPKCDNCGSLEFDVVEDPDEQVDMAASEYFAKLKDGTLVDGEPSSTAICKGCGMRYPC